MKILYRISQNSYPKSKLEKATKENCFKNAFEEFGENSFTVIADNINESLRNFISEYTSDIVDVSVGNGAGTFNIALDLALELPSDEMVYFLEDDYIHRKGSNEVLQNIFKEGFYFNYATLYDHPDKYKNPYEGGNPYCSNKSEPSRVYLSKHCHWKETNSTTMTFASTVSILKEDEAILREYTSDTHPNDFGMFLKLGTRGRKLISSIPGYSTHSETLWLTPLSEWEDML